MHRLLILGLNPGINQLVQDVLLHAGYKSTIFDPLRNLTPSDLEKCLAVVIDDEEEIAAAVRSMDPEIPLIFLSARSRPAELPGVLVFKPFTVDSLVRAVKHALRED